MILTFFSRIAVTMRKVLSIFQIDNLFRFQTVAKNAIHYNLDVRANRFDTLSHPSDTPRADFTVPSLNAHLARAPEQIIY